jgi:hypothetical protein
VAIVSSQAERKPRPVSGRSDFGEKKRPISGDFGDSPHRRADWTDGNEGKEDIEA